MGLTVSGTVFPIVDLDSSEVYNSIVTILYKMCKSQYLRAYVRGVCPHAPRYEYGADEDICHPQK